MGFATYIDSFAEIMHQRKRWLMGAQELPWNWKFLIILYGLFFPALIIVSLYSLSLALSIWLIKFSIQCIFILFLNAFTKTKGYRFHIYLIYEFYLIGLTLLTALFYFLPIKSVWKQRTYSNKGLEMKQA